MFYHLIEARHSLRRDRPCDGQAWASPRALPSHLHQGDALRRDHPRDGEAWAVQRGHPPVYEGDSQSRDCPVIATPSQLHEKAFPSRDQTQRVLRDQHLRG